jgi:hypothetical protein
MADSKLSGAAVADAAEEKRVEGDAAADDVFAAVDDGKDAAESADADAAARWVLPSSAASAAGENAVGRA